MTLLLFSNSKWILIGTSQGEFWGLYHMSWVENAFISLLKKKNQSLSEFRFSWQHILRLKLHCSTAKHLEVHYKRVSVWPPANRKQKIKHSKQIPAPGLILCFFTQVSLLDLHMYSESLTTALMTMRLYSPTQSAVAPISFKCLLEAYQSHFPHCPSILPL